MKNTIIVVLLLALAGGAYYVYSGKEVPSMIETPNENMPTETTGANTVPNEQASLGKHAVSWKFDSVGEDKNTGAQMTKVTVTWDGTSHDAGTYMGSCAEIDGTNGTLQAGEVSGALCWWAGAGDEVGVFNEGGTYVLKHGEQQEPSAESQGFRGNFKTLITL
jgi:hypothetical protein